MYGPYLTTAELKAKYPNEWVFLANPTTAARSQRVTGGHLILHAADRTEFYRLADAWEGPEVKEFAFWWTGEIGGSEMWELPPESAAEPGAA